MLVIADLLDSPEYFVEYLKERIDLNKNQEIKALDELDFLGYYLENGSLKKFEDLISSASPLINGFQENIDRWYSYERGEIGFAEKPKRLS